MNVDYWVLDDDNVLRLRRGGRLLGQVRRRDRDEWVYETNKTAGIVDTMDDAILAVLQAVRGRARW